MRGAAQAAESTAIYTSRVLKASGALAETKLLLAQWDEALPIAANLARIGQDNLLGSATRARAKDISRTFKERYTGDLDVLLGLVELARSRNATDVLDRILYFLTVRSDRLLHDFVLDEVDRHLRSYRPTISVEDVRQWLHRQIAAGRMKGTWSDATTLRAAQGILASLRDFGVLEGKQTKTITAFYLPVGAFAFIAFLLRREQPAGQRLLDHPEWKLFFLSFGAVERFFLEAHQRGLLGYHAAGRTVRIEFPAQTAQEYAHVVATRAD